MLGNGFLADSVISVAVHTRRSWKEEKVIHRTCHFRHTWISDDGEDIYIRKLEKDKQIRVSQLIL